MICEAPEIVRVAEHVCGPVPSGGGLPAVFTEKAHCVPLGVTWVLSWRVMPPPGMLPALSRLNGPLLGVKGTWQGAEPKPLARHCESTEIVTVGLLTGVPAKTSWAFICAPA